MTEDEDFFLIFLKLDVNQYLSVSAAPALPPGTPVTVPPPIIPVPVPVPVPVPALPPGPAMIPSSSFSHAGMVPVGALGISPPTQGVSMLSQQMRPVGVVSERCEYITSLGRNDMIGLKETDF